MLLPLSGALECYNRGTNVVIDVVDTVRADP